MIRWLHGHMLLQPSFFASPQPLYDVRIFPLYLHPLSLQAPFSYSNHYFHCFPLSSLLTGYLRSFILTVQYCPIVGSFQTDGTVCRLYGRFVSFFLTGFVSVCMSTCYKIVYGVLFYNQLISRLLQKPIEGFLAL